MRDGLNEFDGLPEGCIANILFFTTPADACRHSLVSSTFSSAANSNAVWERFLPPDYLSIVSRSERRFQRLVSLSSKKQLYLSLCDDPLIIDDNGENTKIFFLDKWSGKKCYMMASRNLLIILGSSQMQSLLWIPLPESRFVENAFNLSWLEIHANINTSILSSNTKYGAYLVFKLSPGIEHRRVQASVTTRGGTHRAAQIVFFHAKREEMEAKFIVNWSGLRPLLRKSRHGLRGAKNGKFAKGRRDGWLEIEIGEFFGGGDDQVGLCVEEMDGGQFEGGCVIQGIEVRPVDAVPTRLSS